VLLVVAVVVAFTLPAGAVPAEYLPTSHWAYEDLETLWTRGVLDSLSLSARPWTRVEIARALEVAKTPAAGRDPVYRRLAREFARELAFIDAPDAPRETPPLVAIRDGESEIRLSVGVDGIARGAPPSKTQIESGSGAFVAARGYLWPRIFFLTEVRAERTGTDRSIGDSLVRNEDFYLNTGEAYISFAPKYLELTLGLTETRWGPGSTGTLLLSDASIPYGSVRVRLRFAGRLELQTLSGILVQSDHRQLAAHRLALHVTPNLSLGVAEAARYDASSPELLYLLNLLPYTLVERFSALNRERTPEIDQRNNVMMSFDAVWRFRPGGRVWGEFLLDDFATESNDMPHRMAWQFGAAADGVIGSKPVGALFEYTKVFRFTYAVHYDRNFIFRDDPLGFHRGPDSEHYRLRLRADPAVAWSVALDVEWRRQGEGFLGEAWCRPGQPEPMESVCSPPGETFDQWSGLHLTGVIESTLRVTPSVAWAPRDNVRLRAGLGVRSVRNAGHVEGSSDADPELFVSVDPRK
jgi:hypothetical protein